MATDKPKLYYFAARGRAELIRLVFAASGTDFEDVRYTREQWPEKKKDAPTGVLPYVESASEKSALVQSGAIARYYAKKAGLMGANDWEYYLVERALGQLEDVWQEMMKIFFGPEDKKADLTKEFQSGKGQTLLSGLVKFLNESGTGFYVGDSITLADLASISLLDILAIMPDFVAKFPELSEHRKKVLDTNAKVAEWVKNRPQTPF